MRCPTCGGQNVDGAKFCGVCGARMTATTVPPVAEIAPRVTAETRQVPQQPPPLAGASLGESIRVPEAGGARVAKIVFVLAIDAALVIAGIMLMTQGGGSADAAAQGAASGSAAASAGAGAGFGSGVATDGNGAATGSGSVTGDGAQSTGGGGGSAPTGGGGGATTGGGGGATGGGATGGGVRPGSGSGSGSGSVVGSDDPIGAAAAAAAAAAGKIDAGAGTPAIDAGVPAIDAAPAAEVPIDAAEATVDAPEAAASAAELASHLARLVVQSNGKMDRCYQNATKALPDDQPLVGEVDIGLAVMPTGAVQNVRVTRNTTGSNDLASCVQATAAQWAFPAHTENEPVEFVHVFRFGPRTN